MIAASLLLLAWSSVSLAQQGNQAKPLTIKGYVTEADGGAVMYASVAVSSDGKILAGAMTDTTGFFSIAGKMPEKFSLIVSSIGYDGAAREFARGGEPVLDAGVIILSRNTLALNGAVLTAEAPSRSVTVEKTRIDPASSAAASTGSVLEVLRGISSVSVDGNEAVSIRGNGNVLILVDGVPTALGGLSSIPASNVQSIDIITSPDVKYDSEGTGGIISIVSKKQAVDSFNAMASFNYGFNNFLNGNLALSYNRGRWGMRVNYNGKYERDHIDSQLHRRIKQSGSTLDQMVAATKKTAVHNAGINLNFKATEKDILTLDFKAIFPRMNNFQNFDNRYAGTGAPSSKFRQTDITFNRETFESSLGYRHVFDPGKKEISVVGSVSSITGHRPSYYYEEGVMVQKSVSGGHPFNASLQSDYLTVLGKGKFETGIKMTYRQNNIDHKMYELDPATGQWELSVPLSNDLRHREYIPAAYAMYSSKFAASLSYKAGLRAEYSYVTLHSDMQRLDDHSDCWFISPNFVLNWKISQPWSMAFALSRRISRPSYPQLNPYINLIDNQTYETGNMHLKPEKSNKLDLGYSYSGRKVKVNGNAYFNYTTDYINQVAYMDKDILVMTYVNGDMFLTSGIDHSIRLDILRWFSMDISTDTYYTRSRGSFSGADTNNSGWVNNSNAALIFKPLKGMNIQAQYFVTSPQHFPQFTTKTVHYCNIGIKQSFLKNSLTLSALLTDVFNTRRWDIASDNAVYSLDNLSKNLSRMFWLGISWNFNSYKPLNGMQKKGEEDRSVIRLGD